MSENMKAIGFSQNLPIDDPNSLMDITMPKPRAQGHDLLVAVKAIAVNPVDYKIRSQRPPKDKYTILGYDAAGVVTEVGTKVSLFQVGDEVYYAGSVIRPGANSEYHLVDERIVGKKPQCLSFSEAAALPLTTLTAYEGLFDHLRVSLDQKANKDKTILFIAAAGGVGSIGIQLAKLYGLKVIASASRENSMKWVKELGADIVINHHQDFMSQLKENNLAEINYIFCSYDPSIYWERMIGAIAPQGKICFIVEAKEAVNITKLMLKSVSLHAELMFTRSTFQTEDMIKQHQMLNAVAHLIDQKKIKTTLSKVISPINARNLRLAHALLESGQAIGKIVLENFAL